MKEQTSLRQKLFLILGSLILTLFFLEFGLQALSLALRPSLKLETVSELRLLCLGESTTAWGGENSYPKQLQNLLQKKYPSKKIEVINAGVPGTSTLEIAKHLEENLKQFRPHFVLIMMGINDFWANQELLEQKSARFLQHYGEKSKTLKLLHLLWANLNHQQPLTASTVPVLTELDQAKQKLHKQDLKATLDLLKIYIEKNPIPSSFFQAGLIFEEKYQQQEKNPVYLHHAKFFYRQAIHLEPHPQGNTGASLHLALILQNEKKNQEALPYFELAAKSEVWSHTPRAQFYLASFYEKLGKANQAIYFYEEATKIRGQGMEIYWNWLAYQSLIRIWSRENQVEKVREVLARAQLAYPNHSALTKFFEQAENFSLHLAQGQSQMEFETGPQNFYQNPVIIQNYRQIFQRLWKDHIIPIVVSYPRRKLSPLTQHFLPEEQKKVIWVENTPSFEDALTHSSYEQLFVDRFAGDFGHATQLGNDLLAKNILRVLEKSL